MKSRLLLRALCVGAALLVPASGLTVLGIGTASATTATITGQIKLGTLGTLLLTVKCTVPATSGSKQCSLVSQAVIKKTGTSANLKALVTGTLLVTIASSKVTALTVKKPWGATIKATGGLPGNGCVLGTGPKIVFTVGSTGLKGTIATKSLAGVTVGGATCASATKTLVTNDITGSKLSGTIKLSAA
jgi:hypothetical protein